MITVEWSTLETNPFWSVCSIGGSSRPVMVLIGGNQVGNIVTITFGGSFITTGLADYQLNYIVQSLGNPIGSIDQYFTLTSQGLGGIVGIGETLLRRPARSWRESSSAVLCRVLFDSGDYNDPPGEPATGDQLVIDPALLTLWVTKDINLDAYQVSDGDDGLH